jgi:hypothetical protein
MPRFYFYSRNLGKCARLLPAIKLKILVWPYWANIILSEIITSVETGIIGVPTGSENAITWFVVLSFVKKFCYHANYNGQMGNRMQTSQSHSTLLVLLPGFQKGRDIKAS